MKQKSIEIPFGAKDSELKGWEYTIPKGMYAEIKDGKIIVKQQESEDERIRKALIDEIKVWDEDYKLFKHVSKEKVLDYLEKQKEQKPSNTEETELNSIAFLEQLGYTCIPPSKQKEHQNKSDAPGKCSLVGPLNSPFCKGKNLDDIAQEYVNRVKEYNPTPEWNLIQTAVCYGYHLAEQPPAEWSEEDNNNFEDIIGYLNDCVHPIDFAVENRFRRRMADWLKSLRPCAKEYKSYKKFIEALKDYE